MCQCGMPPHKKHPILHVDKSIDSNIGRNKMEWFWICGLIVAQLEKTKNSPECVHVWPIKESSVCKSLALNVAMCCVKASIDLQWGSN